MRLSLLRKWWPIRKRWPTTQLLICTVWAYLSLGVLTPALDDTVKYNAQALAQICILAIIVLRIAFAHVRGEENRIWALYTAILVLAAPIWLAVDEPLWDAASHLYASLTQTSP